MPVQILVLTTGGGHGPTFRVSEHYLVEFIIMEGHQFIMDTL